MAAPNSTAMDANNIEAITTGLTNTVLGDDVVSTDIAAETSTKVDDVDAIANDLGKTMLGEDDKQSLASLPAAKDQAVEENDGEGEPDPAGIAPEQATGEEEDGIDALGAAWGSLSIQYDDAEAQRRAQLLREQITKEHAEKMTALANAESKRRDDAELDQFTRRFQADLDRLKVKKMKRKARKEKNREAARQLRVAAEAEETALAERRAEQERRMQAEAEAAQAKQEADDRAQLELSQIYENILASAAIAKANDDEAQRQQQLREAELIAQYHDAVARQKLADLEQRQREELFQRQLVEQQRLAEQQYLAEHYNAYPLGEQVSQDAEEMEVAPEGVNWEGAEMDTAPEMEAAIRTEMEWEQADEQTPLLAEPLLPLPQSMELSAPFAPEPSATAQELPSSRAMLVVDSFDSEVLEPQASNNRIAEERPAIPAAENVEALSHARTVADKISGPPSAAGSNTATTDQQPVTLAATRPIETNATKPTPSTPAAIEAAPAPASAEAAASPAATEAPGIAAPLPPANVLRPPPRAATPPSPPAPMPAPTTSSPKRIKIVLKRAVSNPALAALRPTICSWSPLGRLLSQKPIPQVALPQVLGKRAMEDREDSGRNKKKARLGGEFKFEVGGKRKREDETFPGKRRVLCDRRVLVVPCSRLAVTPPTNPHTSTPPSTLPAPPPSSPSPLPPPPAAGTLPENHQRGLAEAIEFYNDLPTLREEIAWMRAQRLDTSVKETRGKKTPNNKRAVTRPATPASYWSRYRENLSR